MVYLRWGQELPSGKKSRFFVIGDRDGLVNLSTFDFLSYSKLDKMYELNSGEFTKKIESELDVHGEELEVLCKSLLFEKNK